jgi:acetylglutamate kinase
VTELVVVKLGGEVVASPAMTVIAEDVSAMSARGERVVLVHGGGPQATELQKKLGLAPKIVAGRRITRPSSPRARDRSACTAPARSRCARSSARRGS